MDKLGGYGWPEYWMSSGKSLEVLKTMVTSREGTRAHAPISFQTELGLATPISFVPSGYESGGWSKTSNIVT